MGFNSRISPALRVQVFAESEQLWATAAEKTLDSARVAITKRGVFHLVVAGGKTPLPLYERLALAAADWRYWQIWFGDERCLPDHHPQRNDSALRSVWFEHTCMTADNIHAIPVSFGADEAVQRYAAALPDRAFDVVLLGLGADGHTASLFPGHPLGDALHGPTVLAVHDAPKAPAARVTLSAPRLSRSRQVWVLVTGSDKAAALAAWRRGESLPIAHIRPATGVDIFTDRDAAGESVQP